MNITGSRTLYSIFAANARAWPDREWLVYEREDKVVFRWTSRQLLDRVHQAANLLRELGIGQGDVYNLHLANHPAYLQLMLAASLLGAIAMPTNPVSTADELAYLVEHSESKVIFTEESCVETAQTVAAKLGIAHVVLCQTSARPSLGLLLYEAELAKQSVEAPPGEGAAERVVELLYTSGTTARPKGVMLTNATLIYGAEVFRGATGLRREDRHLIALPLFHAAAQCHALWPSIIADATVALAARFSASRFFTQAVAYGGTMAALFGAPLRMLLNQPEGPDDHAHALRNVTFAQSLTAAQYATWHRRFGVPLQQLWGMTETGGLPVMSPLTGDRNLLAMGRPVVGYEVKVVDADGGEVPIGGQGQLLVRGEPGKTLMLGYLKNPTATATTMRPSLDGVWLYSGDTVRVEEDGFLTFVDRGRDLIKRSGENISSTEVEAVLLDCPDVLDVGVVGLADPVRDEAVVAVVVRAPGSALSEEVIRDYCAARLAPFKVPERVAFVDALPRTSVGKIQKNVVRTMLSVPEERSPTTAHGDAP